MRPIQSMVEAILSFPVPAFRRGTALLSWDNRLTNCRLMLLFWWVPNFEEPFKLAIDASEFGAGAVLLQVGSAGIEHPMSYFSKKFNRSQREHSTIEKEMLDNARPMARPWV